MEKKYKIYRYTSKTSGKYYIGSTSYPIKYRAGCGTQMRGYRHCRHFWNAIQKYGPDDFICDILHDGLSFEEAKILECIEINKHNSRSPNGYNIRGGDDINEVHEETKKLQSQQRQGMNSGEDNPNYRNDIRKHTQDIIRLYLEEFKTPVEIGEIYGCSPAPIKSILKENNIKIRNLSQSLKGKNSGEEHPDYRKDVHDKTSEIIKKYVNDEIPVEQIAEMYNCSWQTINRILIGNNIEIKSVFTDERIKYIRSKSKHIIELYTEHGKSSKEIAEIYSCSNGMIWRILKTTREKSVWMYVRTVAMFWYEIHDFVTQQRAESRNKNIEFPIDSTQLDIFDNFN